MKRRAALALACAACGCGLLRGRESETLRIAVPYEVTTLDPHATLTVSNFATASNFYEPLVRSDASMKVRPCLARSWETVDPLTWVFHLEPDARFHDGRLLRAGDVVYSIQRLLHHPELQIGFFATSISEAGALDPLTVRIRTLRAVNALPNKLNFVLIVPEGSGSETLASHENGTGPYRLLEWRPGDAIRMTRSEGYRGRPPAFADVELLLARTAEQALAELASGRCQIVQSSSKKIEEVARRAGGYRVLRQDSLFVKYLGFDLEHEATPYCSVRPNPFRDLLVREALDRGVDRASLIAALPTHAIPATQPVPRFVFGFNPDIARPTYDPGASRALLRRAGLGEGFAVTLHTRRILEPPARIVAAQLLELGIKATVEVLPEQEFFDSLNEGRLSFFLSRWGSPTGDAGDILDDLFHSRVPERGYGLRNRYGYSNPRVDRLIEQGAGLTDPRLRRASLERAMAAIMDDLPWIPLYVDQDAYAVRASVAWQPRDDSYVLAYEVGRAR